MAAYFTSVLTRLRARWLPLLEATVAATSAWIVDTSLIDHPRPFFAPAATIIVLSQARGARFHRAAEVLAAVAGGVLLADLVAQLLGANRTITIFVLIALSLTITTALDLGPVGVVQATVSALYVAVVTPPTQSWVPDRFIDALVGGCIALLVSQLVTVRDPFAPVVAQVLAICGRIGSVVGQSAAAITAQDPELARAALTEARSSDAAVVRLEEAAAGARESLQLDFRRRERRGEVVAVQAAARQLDYVVRGCRILARAAVGVVTWPVPVTADPTLALHHLESAVGQLGVALVAELRSAPAESRAARAALDSDVMQTIVAARALLDGPQPLPVVMIVGQLRSMTIDLLRGAGGDGDEVIARVDHEFGFLTA